jgi:WD40 repeat protein
MKLRPAVFAALFIASISCSAVPNAYESGGRLSGIQIDTGHQGSIGCLQYDSSRGLLFSGSEDGTVRIWKDGKQFYSVRISHRSVSKLAVHPYLPHIAVLELINSSSSRISVWNWEKSRRLYSIDLNEMPLFLTYSPKGNYLVYSLAEFQSLKLHFADNGKQSPLFNNVFGIVSYITLSLNEENLMTYQPSGRINYWKLATGERIQPPIDAPANLSFVMVPQNKKLYMAAKLQDNLVVVDILTGKIRAKAVLPNITGLSFSPDGNSIACLTTVEGIATLSYWNFTGNALYTSGAYKGITDAISHELTTLSLDGTDLYLGDNRGSLWVSSPYAKTQNITETRLLDISSLSVRDNIVAIGSSQGIIIFTLGTNDRAFRAEDIIQDFDFSIYSNPFTIPVGLEILDSRHMIIWDKSKELKGIARLDTWTGIEGEILLKNSSPLIQVELFESQIVSLEKNGLIRILSEQTDETLFEYTSPGIKKAVFVGNEMLVGAGNRIAQYSASLVKINTVTSETVPLFGSSLLAYDLAHDPWSDSLYSLSMDRVDGETMTVVKRNKGPEYDNEEIIFGYMGEDLSASLDFNPVNSELYTSLGYGPIRVWNGRSVRFFQETIHVPRYLQSSNRLVFSLNRDSTVSIWDKTSRKLLLDLYLFKDLSWIAVFPNENAYISQDADEYLIPGN